MSTAQLEYTSEELLSTHELAEPLVVNDVRCHGGFDDTGTYVSPRTLHRNDAIDAWDAQRAQQFGTPKLELPIETWPENFPNVEQSKLLIRSGSREPTIAALTRIGTVEGFGAMLRYSFLPDLQALLEEDIRGTALAHLDEGLFEAHARDEAGHGDEAGHNVMWFVARDIAFENPVTEDQTQLMLERMGIPNLSDVKGLAKLREAAEALRLLPAEIPFELESLVARMVRLLFIELSAFHGFRWAEAVLADSELVAGEGKAAEIVSYIRADETPHVNYLGTVLSELRDRTWVGTEGGRYAGADMIARIWDASLAQSVGVQRQDFLRMLTSEVERSLDGRTDKDDLMDEFWSLGSVTPNPDGTFADGTDARTAGEAVA